jgi:hypothetical protein
MTKTQYKVFLPPIRDEKAGIEYLSKISEAIVSAPEHDFMFDFSRCSTLSYNAIAVIGGLGDFLKKYEDSVKKSTGLGLPRFDTLRKVTFNIDKMPQSVMTKLQSLGFWNYVKPEHGISVNNDYIGYRQHAVVIQDHEIINHLEKHWLTSEKLSLSDALRDAIISSIYEIFVNAYGHGLKGNELSQSVISCGEFDETKQILCLSVFDLGGGIVKSVRDYIGIKDKQAAFEWALTVGNSTRTDSEPDMPRGLGFGVLQDFVRINEGTLKVCSDNFIAELDTNGNYKVSKIQGFLAGTLVSITINCRKKYHYQFQSEQKSNSETFF